jgi:hypothetical protein
MWETTGRKKVTDSSLNSMPIDEKSMSKPAKEIASQLKNC